MEMTFYFWFYGFVFAMLAKILGPKSFDGVTQVPKKKLSNCEKDRFSTCITFISVFKSMKVEMKEQNIFGL